MNIDISQHVYNWIPTSLFLLFELPFNTLKKGTIFVLNLTQEEGGKENLRETLKRVGERV